MLPKQWLQLQNPNGSDTFIVKSLDYTLDQLKQWSKQPGMAERRQSLYLYTDGIDNVSGTNDPNGWQDDASNLVSTLHQDGYDWRFVPAAGGSFTDSGSGMCH